jgi:DNA recombination protein RmuC
VDCLLILPAPSGNIAIDAKFPLESFQQMQKSELSESNKRQAEQQFRIDIRKHIEDIAEKYIFPPETTDGAVMFIPAEAIFAEIHSHFPDLVELAHRSRVWLVSPTTLMAVLTTARAVLKDAATRKQVHLIQQHLAALAKDFSRFEERMEHLSKHIQKAQQDVEQVHLSSKKITSRFNKIEKVELSENLENSTLSLDTTDTAAV